MRESGASRSRRVSVAAVDVHCHVFNSWDVPVRRFVELVYLEKYPGAVLATPLIDLIELIMRSGAPTTAAEIAYLKQSSLRLTNLKRIRTQEHDINAVSRALTLMWACSPKNRLWVRRHLSPGMRRRLKGKRNVVMTARDFEEAAQHLITAARGDLWTWINFALIYTRWRWEITQELTKTEGPEVFLYTPAILDIGTRLCEPDTSDIGEQVKVMRLIAQIKGFNCAIHPFVAFDPFRAMGDAGALAAVQDAVLNNGAVGVKIYPPMGFKPCANTGDLGPTLDQQMEQFLGFCLQEDVPILAHCCYSQYVSDKDGVCAAPEAWKVFLQLRPSNSSLRLDLGHCGGPWDFKKLWTETVFEMLGSGAYPNLYADLSDSSFILQPTRADKTNIINRLKALLRKHPKALARLLYGSDWSLLARYAGTDGYYEQMKTDFCSNSLHLTDAERQGFLGANALRFLGLTKFADGSKPKNRLRLEKFRRNSGLDMSIFSKIDALVP